MLTGVLCWLLSWLGHEAKKAAMPAATIPKQTSLLVFTFRSFLFDPQFIGRQALHLEPLRCISDLRCRRVSKNDGLCQRELNSRVEKGFTYLAETNGVDLIKRRNGKRKSSTWETFFSTLTSDQLLNNRCRRDLFGSWILQPHFV